VLVRRVIPAEERARAEAEAKRKAKAMAMARPAPEPPAKLLPLSVDDLSDLLGVVAAWRIWYQPEVSRGRWRGCTLSVPATLINFSSAGASLTFRREDTGDDVAATFRPSERLAWVRERPFHLDGWRLNRNVFVSLAAEAPERRLPLT